jgi:hypothetical protein
MLKAARDFGLEQPIVDAIALTFDPRWPDLAQVAEALTDALLARGPLGALDTA